MTGKFTTIKNFNLFPIIPMSENKKPLVKWSDPNNQINNMNEAIEKYPNARAWATVTGEKSGVMVIDIDNKTKGQNGHESLKEILTSLSKEDNQTIKNTLIVRTPNNGMHIYFKYKKGLKTVSNIIPGVDIRTDGGIILSPDSVAKRKDGKEAFYEANKKTGEIKEMPDGLFDYFVSKLKETSKEENKNKNKNINNFYRQVNEGERDDTLFKYVCSMVRKIKNEEELINIADMFNQKYINPPLPDKVVREKVNSALKYKTNNNYDWKDVTIITKRNGDIEIKPLNTIDNFKLILERTGTKIYKNEITKVLSVETNFFKNKTLDTLITEIKSHCTKEHFKLLKTDVRDYIEAIGNENAINPFKVWMDQLPSWDKTSRIENYLENFVTVDGYDKDLKKLLMTKWLLSFCGSVYDPNYKAYGLLILKGEQGIGKGECFKRLIPINEDWVFLGEQEYKGDRDNIQILTSHLIVEFSEFARSAKKVNEFKGFVTAEKDSLSLKYDKYITTNKRTNIYFATVNDAEFLLDDNNRRMWVIDLESINWEGINNFNYTQLWAELKEIYLANPIIKGQPCYHLLNDEKDKLQESNKNYNFKSELGTVLESLLDFDNPQRLWVRSAEVLTMIDVKASGTSIARELKKLGEETSKDTPIKGLPRGRYNSCPLPRNWCGEIPKRFKNRLKDQHNLKLVEVSKESVEVSTDKKIKELQNKNIELLTEKRNLLEKIDVLENKLKELLEINSWYEQNFNKKEV